MLFVYGTLQDADVLAAVLGRRVVMTSLRLAVAPGFRAVAYPGRVYPALVPSPDASAPGLLLDDIAGPDLLALDAFEGDEYRRCAIDIEIDGRTLSATAYLPVIDIAADGPTWSLDAWTDQHKSAVIAGEVETATAIRQRLSADRML